MNKYKVIIADDEALIRLDLKEMLIANGYEVIGEAKTGREALSLARVKKPDIIIMDVKMPDLDGLAATKKITEEKLAPVLLLTAFSQEEFIKRAAKNGAIGYLVKPIDEERLLPAVEVAVSSWREKMTLCGEIERMKNEIESRKLIERAKGIVMKKYSLSEDEAYQKMRSYSMKKQISLEMVAKMVLKKK